MRPLMLLQGGGFAALVLAVGAAAGARLDALPPAPPQAWLDGSATRAFERHYDQAFPARTLGTNVWAAVDYLLFGEGRPGVVVGTQGWLYTDEEFRGYAGAQAALDAHLSLIAWVRDELTRRGSRLVVALVPAKARVYPEFRGDHEPAAVHRELYARAFAAASGAGVPAPDLHAALVQCKARGLTFLRTDTHWTPEGVRCVAVALAPLARDPQAPAGPAAPYRTRVERVEKHHGDLVRYLPLAPHFEALLPEADELAIQRTAPPPAGDEADALLGDAPPPRVALVGTSYSADARWNLTGALQEALQEDVVSYAALGKGPFVPMLEYLLRQDELPAPPRVVIWEIPERYLPWPQDLRVERRIPADCAEAHGKTRGTPT
jgi:alginate O-acetyltransferase complex protein AlgJ